MATRGKGESQPHTHTHAKPDVSHSCRVLTRHVSVNASNAKGDRFIAAASYQMGISYTRIIVCTVDLTHRVVLASFQEFNRLPVQVSEHVLSCDILKMHIGFQCRTFSDGFSSRKLEED